MTEHLNEREVSLFRDRTITSADRERIEAHVAACESCLLRILPVEDQALAYRELTESLLGDNSEAPFHLSNEELREYAGGTVDQTDRLIFESHLDICSQCSEVLQTVTANPPVEQQRASGQIMQPDFLPEASTGWWRPAVLFTPSRAIAAAIIIAGLLFALLVWQRRHSQSEDLTARQSASPTFNAPSPSASEAPTQPPVESADQPTGDQPGIIASLNDNGRRIELDRAGKLDGLEELPEASRVLVRTALNTKSFPKPDVLDKLTGPSITLMDPTAGASSFELIAPSRTVIVSDRPNLRWKPLADATSYTVSVFDTDFNLVAKSSPQPGTHWITPSLRRGTIYSWEVVAVRDGQEVRSPIAPAPRAQFKVVEADQLSELAEQKQLKPVSHLALGLAYARLGMLPEAESQLQVLAKENPDSVIAKRLLQTVREWQRR